MSDCNDAGEQEMLTCPFCRDTDFDAVGLKRHFLLGHCDEFENTSMNFRSAPINQQEGERKQ